VHLTPRIVEAPPGASYPAGWPTLERPPPPAGICPYYTRRFSARHCFKSKICFEIEQLRQIVAVCLAAAHPSSRSFFRTRIAQPASKASRILIDARRRLIESRGASARMTTSAKLSRRVGEGIEKAYRRAGILFIF
jgi:hypothetical protein